MTVAELLHRISSRELTEWMLYYQMEPFGEERADLRAGIISSTIANVHRDPDKGKPFKPQDFIPQFVERVKESKTAKQLLGAAEKIFGAFASKDSSHEQQS